MQKNTDSPAQRRRKKDAVYSALVTSVILAASAALMLYVRAIFLNGGLGSFLLLILSVLDLGMLIPVWILLKKRIKGNTAQLRQRISADLLRHFCSSKNGKYIQYSPVFETLNWHKISR